MPVLSGTSGRAVEIFSTMYPRCKGARLTWQTPLTQAPGLP